MRLEYEYAETKMVLELDQVQDSYVLHHAQYIGNPDSSLTKIFGTVKYNSKLNASELALLADALSARAHEKIKVAKGMYVTRSKGALSMVHLKFPKSLESVPLPREISDSFIGIIHNAISS